jgi:hypothetical protein
LLLLVVTVDVIVVPAVEMPADALAVAVPAVAMPADALVVAVPADALAVVVVYADALLVTVAFCVLLSPKARGVQNISSRSMLLFYLYLHRV